MATRERIEDSAEVSVKNIGGIEGASLKLQPGTNVLVGRNATNRTSFLKSIMAALGSDNISMKGDANEAAVELELGDDCFQRTLTRDDETVSLSGDPYLDDPVLADLFAFLLESNEARRTVATNGDLRSLIMRPVDLQAINSEISELEEQRDKIDNEIEAIEARKRDLPELDSQKNELEEEISEVRTKLEKKEREIESADADVESRREEKQELETKLEELRETRSNLDDARYDIEAERESIQSLKEERSTVSEELDKLSAPNENEIEELESRIDQLRERRRHVDNQLNSLQATIQFNEEMLEGERTDLSEELSEQSEITDELLPGDEITCWTCGSEVERDRIESTVNELRTLRQEKLGDKREISSTIEDVREKTQTLRQEKQRKQDLQRRLSNTEDELERRNERLQGLQDRRSDLEASVQDVEKEVERIESGQFEEILDLHREANELEYKLGGIENSLDSVQAEIDDIEKHLSKLSELESEREAITEELTDLRTHIEQLEQQAIDQFNGHMEEILDIFMYENVERIWIERVQREVQEGRTKSIKTFFEMHVVRSTSGGTSYEDTIDHLSESEREVTGLVFALAGYLAHDVHEEVPFMLIDSLEAIDSARIAELVEYFGDFPEYLVVALLPEDAQALSEEYHRIQEI